MNEQELKNLDEWIAEHVFGWKLLDFTLNPDPSKPLRGIWWIFDGDAYADCESYSSDPAAAMQVLEKCAEKVGDIIQIRFKNGIFGVTAFGNPFVPTAETLPLATALFAKELFK